MLGSVGGLGRVTVEVSQAYGICIGDQGGEEDGGEGDEGGADAEAGGDAPGFETFERRGDGRRGSQGRRGASGLWRLCAFPPCPLSGPFWRDPALRRRRQPIHDRRNRWTSRTHCVGLFHRRYIAPDFRLRR